MLAHGESNYHLVIAAYAVFIAEIEIYGREIHETGSAASRSDLEHVGLDVLYDVIRVESAVFALHGLEGLRGLVVYVFDHFFREVVRRVVPVRDAGVTLHYVVAVRQYEFQLSVLYECLGAELLAFDIFHPDLEQLKAMVAKSVAVKERIVTEDPLEHGIRKALNLGHTAGHAFESMALAAGKPVLHGFAVAWGLVCELYLSATRCGFPTERLYQVAQFVKETYGTFAFTCMDYDRLYELMTHDKKNTAGVINFTLLGGVGDIRINQQTSRDDIFEMLDYYRES